MKDKPIALKLAKVAEKLVGKTLSPAHFLVLTLDAIGADYSELLSSQQASKDGKGLFYKIEEITERETFINIAIKSWRWARSVCKPAHRSS